MTSSQDSRWYMDRTLIIAYGNPLRSDDGVAWRAADMLAEKLSASAVEILRLHQLAPELADTLRGFDRVIFIDASFSEAAAIEPGTIHMDEIAAQTPDLPRFSHAFSPQKVLGLAVELYGVQPRAFSVNVQGANFDHGNALSAPVANALPGLISAIERLVVDAEGEAQTT
jgi:hydrogenase maturation protease